jgi:hypothetical protein
MDLSENGIHADAGHAYISCIQHHNPVLTTVTLGANPCLEQESIVAGLARVLKRNKVLAFLQTEKKSKAKRHKATKKATEVHMARSGEKQMIIDAAFLRLVDALSSAAPLMKPNTATSSQPESCSLNVDVKRERGTVHPGSVTGNEGSAVVGVAPIVTKPSGRGMPKTIDIAFAPKRSNVANNTIHSKEHNSARPFTANDWLRKQQSEIPHSSFPFSSQQISSTFAGQFKLTSQ